MRQRASARQLDRAPGGTALRIRHREDERPDTGLEERPEDFDYSWSGLARWTGEGRFLLLDGGPARELAPRVLVSGQPVATAELYTP